MSRHASRRIAAVTRFGGSLLTGAIVAVAAGCGASAQTQPPSLEQYRAMPQNQTRPPNQVSPYGPEENPAPPPSWYYNPYTDGTVALPQRPGD